MKITEIKQGTELFDKAVQVFWGQWGNEGNYKFYNDAILHSCNTSEEIPRFYVALNNKSIIGTYALIRNDLNSRQDLWPWLACLYVDPEFRGNEMGSRLLEHALKEAARKGFSKLYLTSDLEGYYEKYGWTHLTECYGASGGSIKLYEKSTSLNDKP
ncbi:GNAT family N-acetyltransferase [Bacillus sp. IB182487]|uniref:GNAT family N-acetyltransferase n=1 Tax=Metabacillus arenae TaxID=2771434 RepID=A0A926RZZ0_9BACI|nr:GNAT family N-acetyltransferase [Metabacillus arenae]MBD1383345.1 GNAT family N-acetyltransferase [Metabacillus arenae]